MQGVSNLVVSIHDRRVIESGNITLGNQ